MARHALLWVVLWVVAHAWASFDARGGVDALDVTSSRNAELCGETPALVVGAATARAAIEFQRAPQADAALPQRISTLPQPPIRAALPVPVENVHRSAQDEAYVAERQRGPPRRVALRFTHYRAATFAAERA